MVQAHRLTFEVGRAPQRLDHFLAESLPELTRSQLKKLVDGGRARIDGSPVKAGLKLKGGEVVELSIPEAAPVETLPEAIPLAVLYEDPHLIVIDKPAGLVVHPAPGHSGGTLVNALLHHCRDLSGVGGELRPGIVHRLDKDTSGVMVATKDDATHNALALQFKDHSITRRYVALVHGLMERASGSVDQAIGRHPTDRKKMSGRSRAGRRAVTHWRVLRRYEQDRLSLVELRLETGRTHQIRVHFSEMQRPVVGDPLYGSASRANAINDLELRRMVLQLHRQALHARVLGFHHPARKEYVDFQSPVPPDMQAILDYLNKKYGAE